MTTQRWLQVTHCSWRKSIFRKNLLTRASALLLPAIWTILPPVRFLWLSDLVNLQGSQVPGARDRRWFPSPHSGPGRVRLHGAEAEPHGRCLEVEAGSHSSCTHLEIRQVFALRDT